MRSFQYAQIETTIVTDRKMVFPLLCLFLLVVGVSSLVGLVTVRLAHAERLPDHLVRCDKDSDCELYHDACHSCGDFIAIRKDAQESTRAYFLERAIRNKESIRSCEWCATPSYKTPRGCRDGRCTMLGIWAPTPAGTANRGKPVG